MLKKKAYCISGKLLPKTNASPLGTFYIPLTVILAANAKVENLEKVVVNNAAEVNFIDKDFCNKNSILTRYTPDSGVMGNHTEQNLGETSRTVLIQIVGYTEKLRFAVSSLR